MNPTLHQQTATGPAVDGDVLPLVQEARSRIAHVVQGMESTVTLLMVALGAKGHILMEGPPGVGKTTLAKAFAEVTGLDFARVQLTPDLMPADITGHGYYDQKDKEFRIRKGPVFTNLLLADEINRTPPRTQSALLEVMQEAQVTIEGESLPVPRPFMVVATKNPIEVEGVYPLPEAERDRFMVHTRIQYPPRNVEAAILDGKTRDELPIEPVAGLVAALQGATDKVLLNADLRSYALDLVRATRDHPMLSVGASPRGSVHLAQAARAHAALEGRAYVIPEDIRDLALPLLRHRLILTPDAEVQELDVDEILAGIIDQVPVPVAPRT